VHTDESRAEALRQRHERAERERSVDPIGYKRRENDRLRQTNVVLTFGTAVGVLFVFFFAFPHAKDFADYLSEPGKAWRLPVFFFFGGLAAYFVKSFSLVIFGTVEIVSGCASAFLSLPKITAGIENGWAAWALLLGLLYLVAKGIENLDKGFKEPFRQTIQELRDSLGGNPPKKADGA
jgi:hypothetical protein